jgi:hypothetical protein
VSKVTVVPWGSIGGIYAQKSFLQPGPPLAAFLVCVARPGERRSAARHHSPRPSRRRILVSRAASAITPDHFRSRVRADMAQKDGYFAF